MSGLFAGGLGCASSPEQAGEQGAEGGEAEVIRPQDRPEMEWWRKSQETREARVAWFREARFGMFIHWGAYSHLGGVWEGKPVKGYAEHIMRRNKIPIAVYEQKAVAPFNPTEFNADEWVATLKNAGMGYLIITAKHHDGFAMYDSQVSDYNIVKKSAWKRDPMKELKAACQKHGVKFGFYYSQAWEWHHPDSPGNDWDYENPGGERKLHGGAEYWKQNPQLVEKMAKYVDGKVIPQVQELIKNYDPDIMWFDTPGRLPPELNLRTLKAAREAKPTLVVNSRIVQPMLHGPPANFGDYFSTTDKPAEFPPHDGDWEGIPTTNESYGWHKEDTSHKPASHFVQLLAKAAASGGNILLNIGPMGNGKFDPKDVEILNGMGAWMKANRESVVGTARTPLPVQAWGESTRKGNTLYLHVLSWPNKGRIVVGGLKSPVKKAYLLADQKRAALTVEKAGDKDVIIQGPEQAPDPVDSVVALEIEGDVQTDPARLLSVDVPADGLRAFDAQIAGGLVYGAGKARDAYVFNWTRMEEWVRWKVRVREPATYEVSIVYDAEKPSVGGAFEVRFATGKVLPGTVAETPSQAVVLGKVTLEPGTYDVTIDPVKINPGTELMRLRGLNLIPEGAAVATAGPAKKKEKPVSRKVRRKKTPASKR